MLSQVSPIYVYIYEGRRVSYVNTYYEGIEDEQAWRFVIDRKVYSVRKCGKTIEDKVDSSYKKCITSNGPIDVGPS